MCVFVCCFCVSLSLRLFGEGCVFFVSRLDTCGFLISLNPKLSGHDERPQKRNTYTHNNKKTSTTHSCFVQGLSYLCVVVFLLVFVLLFLFRKLCVVCCCCCVVFFFWCVCFFVSEREACVSALFEAKA